MGFQNLQTLSLSLFPLWIFRPIFQAFCPKMEGCGDFSPNISSARLAEYNSVLQCGRGVKSWSFQQVWCLHPHSEKLKSPPRRLVIIYSATVLRGGRSGPQGAGCCVTRRAELVCLEKEVRLQCPGGVICLCSAWGSVVKTLSEPQSPEAQPASSSSPCVPERCCFIIPILLWARFFP